MVVDVAGCTHVGKVRRENQDSFLADRLTLPAGQTLYVLGVADGMGGHQKGRQASEEAIDEVRNQLRGWVRHNAASLADLEALALESAAHERVSKLAENGETVGTTLTLALVHGTDVLIAHVGDSRVYHLRGGRLDRVTGDHTWEAWSAEMGIDNPYGNKLRQAVGVGKGVDPDTQQLSLMEGDWVLVCSDGLHKMVPDAVLEKVLRSSRSANEACQKLLDLALRNGGRDNIAISIAHASPCGRQGTSTARKPSAAIVMASAIVLLSVIAIAIWYALNPA